MHIRCASAFEGFGLSSCGRVGLKSSGAEVVKPVEVGGGLLFLM